MKKKVRFLSTALAVLLILPMLFAFVVSADEPIYPSYADAQDGDLLYQFDFRGDSHWTPAISSNDNYNDVEVVASADGASATFTSLGTNNKRALWDGGSLVPNLPLTEGVKYTFLFHLAFGDSNTPYFGYYLDGTQGVVLKGDGTAHRFQWGSTKASDTVTGWISWADKTDVEGLSQDFAQTFDYDTKTVALYVKKSDGSYAQVLETVLFDETLDGATALNGAFFAQGINADATVTVSDFGIYKGFVEFPAPTEPTTDPTTDPTIDDAIYKPYDEAQDGDVIYEANFKGDGIWNPENGSASAWDSMITEVSADGKSVVLSSKRDHDKGRALWGGSLKSDLYTAVGSSYTVEFTVTAEADDQLIGFYPDGGTGFVVKPGQNLFSVGQWGNWNKVHKETSYLGTGSLTQTYAVEIAVSNELRTVKDGSYYTVTDYRLFVKIGENWSLVYELSEDVNCAHADLSGISELAAMLWTTGGDEDMCLKFFRSPSQDKTVTLSDLTVYKGLVVTPLAQSQAEFIPGTLNVDSFEDGELIWEADFTDTENFTEPGILAEGLPVLNAVVDETDPGKVTLSVPDEEDGNAHYWGGQIKGLPLDDEQQYTVFFTVTRSAETSETDPVVGISVDGAYYMTGDSSYLQLTKNGSAKVRSAVKYSEMAIFTILGNHEDDYSDTTEPFSQVLAIEIDGPNISSRAIRLYALDTDGIFQLISNSDSSSNVQFMNANLSLYFFQKDAGQPVTIENIQVYKGKVVDTFNDMMGDDPTVIDPGNTENPGTTDSESKTTAAGQTTTEEPVQTTTEAPAQNATEEPAKKNGCKGTLSSAAILLTVAVLSSSVVFIRKRKHSDRV